MVEVDVRIAERMDEIARPQSALLRNHHSQQGIRRYIERYAEERIGTALIELA